MISYLRNQEFSQNSKNHRTIRRVLRRFQKFRLDGKDAKFSHETLKITQILEIFKGLNELASCKAIEGDEAGKRK